MFQTISERPIQRCFSVWTSCYSPIVKVSNLFKCTVWSYEHYVFCRKYQLTIYSHIYTPLSIYFQALVGLSFEISKVTKKQEKTRKTTKMWRMVNEKNRKTKNKFAGSSLLNETVRHILTM